MKRAGAAENVRFRHKRADGKYVLLEGTLTNLLHDPNIRAFLLNFRESREKVETLDKIRSLNEELRRRLTHLQSLRRIDMAINNSVDMRLVLDIFMAQLLQDLNVDAVAVLLYEPALQVLRPFMGRALGRVAAGKRAAVRRARWGAALSRSGSCRPRGGGRLGWPSNPSSRASTRATWPCQWWRRVSCRAIELYCGGSSRVTTSGRSS